MPSIFVWYLSKNGGQQRLVYKLSDERFAISLLFFISMHVIHVLYQFKVLVSKIIEPTFNACATEDHFTFLGREKANLFKRI